MPTLEELGAELADARRQIQTMSVQIQQYEDLRQEHQMTIERVTVETAQLRRRNSHFERRFERLRSEFNEPSSSRTTPRVRF